MDYQDPPPSYGQYQPTPPSGYRVPLHTQDPFPADRAGQPVAHDLDGSPIFLGSALLENSVHPCKIGPHLQPSFVAMPYGGVEHHHHGRYDLLPFDPQSMEWVLTSWGAIPKGRKPVEGGYEDGGEFLYHALGEVNGVKVPGKTGNHLGGANLSFGGGEHVVNENYYVLCWR